MPTAQRKVRATVMRLAIPRSCRGGHLIIEGGAIRSLRRALSNHIDSLSFSAWDELPVPSRRPSRRIASAWSVVVEHNRHVGHSARRSAWR